MNSRCNVPRPTVAINHMHTPLQYCTLPELKLNCHINVEHRPPSDTDSTLTFLLPAFMPGSSTHWQGQTDGCLLVPSAPLAPLVCLRLLGCERAAVLSPFDTGLSKEAVCFEIPGVRHSTTPGKVISCIPILKVSCQCIDTWFQSNRLHEIQELPRGTSVCVHGS